MSLPRTTRFLLPLATLSLGLSLGVPRAVVAELPSPAAPAVPDPTLPQARRLQLRFLSDAQGAGREHSFTDAAFGSPPAPPTTLERAKLDLARAAVEASRRAGTLLLLPRIEEPLQELDVFAPQRKLALMRSRPPAVLRPDAAAGLAADQHPIQRVGPPGLTPLEIAKLKGLPLPSLPPAVCPAAEEAPAMGDGSQGQSPPPTHAGSPAREDDRHD
ncbi:MAG: hypothetical protein A2W00_12700 [Candidatus Eisenbacteria bacterium RBG_16_71_46]|nr:MAG: hypothetical protein A2W00_12700 [Candidatus Eisenbacteria bacterium RBG_16_71_46]